MKNASYRSSISSPWLCGRVLIVYKVSYGWRIACWWLMGRQSYDGEKQRIHDTNMISHVRKSIYPHKSYDYIHNKRNIAIYYRICIRMSFINIPICSHILCMSYTYFQCIGAYTYFRAKYSAVESLIPYYRTVLRLSSTC